MSNSPSLEKIPVLSVPYLSKVFGGLVLIACWIIVSAWLPYAGLAGYERAAVLALLVVTGASLPLWVWWRYLRMDELQQRLHERASTFAVSTGLAGLLLAELLHGQGLLPTLSPIAIAIVMLALWGLGLALAHEKVS